MRVGVAKLGSSAGSRRSIAPLWPQYPRFEESGLGSNRLCCRDFLCVEDHSDGMQDRCDAHRSQDFFLGQALLAESLLMRVHTGCAIVDRRYHRGPQFEIERINAMGADRKS